MTTERQGVALATATAHREWDRRWTDDQHRALWSQPQPEVAGLMPWLETRGVRRVLDLGCGIGRHALALAAAGFEVTAIDASDAGVAFTGDMATEKGLALSIHRGLMTDLPFAAAGFDYVLAWNVVYHGDETVVARTLDEIRRVLTGGGIFQGTFLSKRNANFGKGTRVAADTFVIDEPGDKVHPHFYANAGDVVRLLDGFELLSLDDREQRRPGGFHWQFVAERLNA